MANTAHEVRAPHLPS